jgi:hypothetical protein
VTSGAQGRRLTRFYYYSYRGQYTFIPHPTQIDTGLVNQDGSLRGIYNQYKNKIH